MRYYFLFFVLVATLVISSSYIPDSTDIPYQEQIDKANNVLPQTVKPIKVKESYFFVDDNLPMHNFDVKERLERELIVNAYRHSSSILILKNSRRYFPLIEKILAEENMPDDLKFLAVAESGLQNVTSPAGAKGVWQFMSGTAKEKKLEVNKEIDERFHLEKSTRAACQYLKKLKGQFGSWTLAAAAYNVGPSRLRKEITNQKAQSLFDMNLNAETSRYIFRIVALKELINNPLDFGFQFEDNDYYYPLPESTDVVVNDVLVNWAEFASKYNITYRQLKIYNPWLIASILHNKSKKTYIIKVPIQ